MSDQLIEPVDVEQAVIDELAAVGYTAGTSLPQTMPNLFIRLVSTGGDPQTLVSDQFQVVIEVFALREATAATAANTVLARLQLAARKGRLGNETCHNMDIVSLPQNYPLPSVPSHKRYLMTLAPTLRRRVTTV